MSGYKPPINGGGTSDHAALTNLAYDDSGHTGFVFDAHDDDGQVPYFSGGWGVIDISTFATTFLDDANASAVCTTLGAEKTSNKNASSGYMGLTSASAASVANRTINFARTKIAWTTAVAITVNTGITGNSDFMLNLPYWLERVGGGSTRKSATWRHLLRRAGGTLSILNNGEVGSIGGFAPTQAWAVSGDNITWTITSAGSDGYVSYFLELLDCSDMTVA